MGKKRLNLLGKVSLRPVSWGGVFEAMGPSKNAYFEDFLNRPTIVQDA